MGSLYRYIVIRIALLFVVLIGITLITFVITNCIPADPARMALGPRAKPEQLESYREELGLNKPLVNQYLIYLKNLLKGDLGVSIETGRPVTQDILSYLPATLELVIITMLLSLVVGLSVGVLAAVLRNTIFDHFIRFISLAGIALPVFWVGLLLQIVFYGNFGILPAQGRLAVSLTAPSRITGLYLVDSLTTGEWNVFFNTIKHLILPSITGAIVTGSIIIRTTRANMLEVIKETFVVAARSRGLNEFRINIKYAFKNAFIPTLTIIGLAAGNMLAATILLVEAVFSWPGVGFYVARAVDMLDFPVIMGVTLIICFSYAVLNLLIDIFYVFIDRRITFS